MTGSREIEMARPAEPETYVGHRIVLTCRSELSFCGLARTVLQIDGRSGLLMETDSRSGLSVWCPLDYVKSITIIPIPPGAE